MFSNRKILEFRDNDMKKSISVYPIPRTNTFKVVRGISIKDQMGTTELNKTAEEIKQLWIDSIVNGYTCIHNEMFENGLLDCLPNESIEIMKKQIQENRNAMSEEQKKTTSAEDILYSS